MKTLLLLFAASFSLSAQITVTEARSSPEGASLLRVENTGTVPLAALVVSYRLVGRETPQFEYFDELTDATPPKQKVEIMPVYVTPRSGKAVLPRLSDAAVTAAIFADGTTTGDADLIRRIVLRRCLLLQAVETSLDMIAEAGRHNVSRSRMIADFKRMSESVRRWYLPQELQVGARVYQPIVGKLINLQEGPLGTAFPPAAFVEQETARLNRQRTVLMASQPSLAEEPRFGR